MHLLHKMTCTNSTKVHKITHTAHSTETFEVMLNHCMRSNKCQGEDHQNKPEMLQLTGYSVIATHDFTGLLFLQSILLNTPIVKKKNWRTQIKHNELNFSGYYKHQK